MGYSSTRPGRIGSCCRDVVTSGITFVRGTPRVYGSLTGSCSLCYIAGNSLATRAGELGGSKLSGCFGRVFVSSRVKFRGPDVRFFRPILGTIRHRGDRVVVVKSSLADSVGNNGGTNVGYYFCGPRNGTIRSSVGVSCRVGSLNRVCTILRGRDGVWRGREYSRRLFPHHSLVVCSVFVT